MAKSSRKSSRKRKATPAPRARNKARARAKPVRKTVHKPVRKPAHNTRDPLDDFIAAASAALALPVKPQWQPAIKANLEVTLRFASLVAEFALPDEAEPAPVFEA